jgi:hypothetical protein
VPPSRAEWGTDMSQREFDENARLYASGQISRRRFISRMVAAGAGVAAAVAFADVATAGAWGRSRKRSRGPWGHHYGHVYGQYGRPGQYGKPCKDHVYGHKPPKHDWPPIDHPRPPNRDDAVRSFWARWSARGR